jgi:hypothetical protein
MEEICGIFESKRNPQAEAVSSSSKKRKLSDETFQPPEKRPKKADRQSVDTPTVSDMLPNGVAKPGLMSELPKFSSKKVLKADGQSVDTQTARLASGKLSNGVANPGRKSESPKFSSKKVLKAVDANQKTILQFFRSPASSM